MKKKIISCAVLLIAAVTSVCMLRVPFTAAEAPGSAGQSQLAQDNISGAAILHCFNWSYSAIKNNMSDIAAAGYTAVQTSPVQKPKDYSSSYTIMSDQWWKLYQPLTLSVADGGTWLGTKAQLTAMCNEADRYNIKVIVDIVSNHMANKSSGGGYSNLNTNVESDLKNSAYYHTETYEASNDTRYKMTHGHIGMPDLNTGNSHVQQRVLGLLKECVDCGVDGFRFDAAKHIELPSDDTGTGSDFWSTVINGIKSYKSDVYCYGEILDTAIVSLSNYTRYMDVTDNKTGNAALTAAKNSSASSLASSTYQMGAGASRSVLWAESHDTYMDNETSGVSNAVIAKAWAITGARASSTSLYLARPNSTMGLASTDTSWKSTAVSEVNKFKNFFMGQTESLSYSGKTAYIERGTKGVSIAKLDGGGSVSLTAKKMAAGTYTDQVSGNTFTVSGGKITGTVGSTGVAVVYNTTPEQETTAPTTAEQTTTAPVQQVLAGDADADGTVTIKDATAIQRQAAGIENIQNNKAAGDCNGDGSITVNDATLVQKYLSRYSDHGIVGQYVDPQSEETTAEPTTAAATEPTTAAATEPTAETQEYEVYFTNSRGWTGSLYCYYWSAYNTNMVTWPGAVMTYEQTNSNNQKIYVVNVPADAEYLIFSNNDKQTVNIPFDGSVLGFYAKATTDSTGKYLYGTW